VSCRALGRGIEQEFLEFIILKIHNEKISTIETTYIKSQKNVQIPNFLLGVGFKVLEDNGNEVKYIRSGVVTSSRHTHIEIVEEK
jgi:predicted enzyme involved in methoxymalonyl-ACP biosynthesis